MTGSSGHPVNPAVGPKYSSQTIEVGDYWIAAFAAMTVEMKR
jgi:hypothetical protein